MASLNISGASVLAFGWDILVLLHEVNFSLGLSSFISLDWAPFSRCLASKGP